MRLALTIDELYSSLVELWAYPIGIAGFIKRGFFQDESIPFTKFYVYICVDLHLDCMHHINRLCPRYHHWEHTAVSQHTRFIVHWRHPGYPLAFTASLYPICLIVCIKGLAFTQVCLWMCKSKDKIFFESQIPRECIKNPAKGEDLTCWVHQFYSMVEESVEML